MAIICTWRGNFKMSKVDNTEHRKYCVITGLNMRNIKELGDEWMNHASYNSNSVPKHRLKCCFIQTSSLSAPFIKRMCCCLIEKFFDVRFCKTAFVVQYANVLSFSCVSEKRLPSAEYIYSKQIYAKYLVADTISLPHRKDVYESLSDVLSSVLDYRPCLLGEWRILLVVWPV